GAQGLLDLPDLQCAWLLLLYCAAPRAQHLLRTLPPDLSAGYANAHDQAIWDTLQVLLGGSPTPDSAAWAAARRLTFLPQSDGGLEVPSAVLTAPAAFWADSLPIIHARWPGVAERCVGELVSGSRAPSLRAGAGELLDRAGFSPGMARVHARVTLRGLAPGPGLTLPPSEFHLSLRRCLEQAWIRVTREALGPEGRVVPQQWLSHTTAPGVCPADRRRLDLVVYGASRLGEALCCDVTLVSPLRAD
ncbi:132 kDa protein, partial [Durusdinium trenchii]